MMKLHGILNYEVTNQRRRTIMYKVVVAKWWNCTAF